MTRPDTDVKLWCGRCGTEVYRIQAERCVACVGPLCRKCYMDVGYCKSHRGECVTAKNRRRSQGRA